METPTHILILFFFLLILISIIGLSLSGARVELRTLRARLDRRDAVEANPIVKAVKASAEFAASVNEFSRVLKDKEHHIKQLGAELEAIEQRNGNRAETINYQFKEIEALEHTITLKDEEIKHLNGDIAKLKFDYAAEVAGRNEGKSDTLKESPLRGEWVDESTYLNPDENTDGRL